MCIQIHRLFYFLNNNSQSHHEMVKYIMIVRYIQVLTQFKKYALLIGNVSSKSVHLVYTNCTIDIIGIAPH